MIHSIYEFRGLFKFGNVIIIIILYYKIISISTLLTFRQKVENNFHRGPLLFQNVKL